jgi:hypothetical protein
MKDINGNEDDKEGTYITTHTVLYYILVYYICASSDVISCVHVCITAKDVKSVKSSDNTHSNSAGAEKQSNSTGSQSTSGNAGSGWKVLQDDYSAIVDPSIAKLAGTKKEGRLALKTKVL